jgi:DNA (cytosine-5)-methyltransferase 1
MTHGSLFSGIGGFDLAAEWAGWTNVFNCENEPFCKQVLKYHFPKAIQYDDITKTKFKAHRGTVDVISGGFPCQPFSQAGKRKGEADERYLWSEMLRAIREIQPRWVVAENVRGIITIERGMVFERVQADLENAGYKVQPFVLPACAVGAPHERYRVFFVAHRADTRAKSLRKRTKQVHQEGTASDTTGSGCHKRRTPEKDRTKELEGVLSDVVGYGEGEITANTLRNGLEHALPARNRRTEFENADCLIADSELCGCSQDNKEEPSEQFKQDIPNWENFPTVSPVCSGDDGFPINLDTIALLGRKYRTQRTAFRRWRKESIHAFGNAVVPQEVYEIFRIINEVERLRLQ